MEIVQTDLDPRDYIHDFPDNLRIRLVTKGEKPYNRIWAPNKQGMYPLVNRFGIETVVVVWK
jgi:hypothetical protein